MDALGAGAWGYVCGGGGKGGGGGDNDGCAKWLIAGIIICVVLMIGLVYVGLTHGYQSCPCENL